MSSDLVKLALQASKSIQGVVEKVSLPPEEITKSQGERVIPSSIVRATGRGYLLKVVHQINNCYELSCYDACAVMIRRVLETLIIETYEQKKIEAEIKDKNGNYLHLGGLIDCALKESSLHLGRKTRAALPKLKELGDSSAHGRRYNANRQDIDKLCSDLRVVVQEFVYLAYPAAP
jgi:hypothetical protein